MDIDTPENRKILITEHHFHGLASDPSFSIQSPCTEEYNCIAWAMGFDDRWVDASADDYVHKKWWPENVEKDWTQETLVKAFEKLGFEICDNGIMEPGFDKVALYSALQSDGSVKWTHAARIVRNNIYHSKIGNLFDVYHSGGCVFADTTYGTVYKFMRREISKRAITEKIKSVPVMIPNDKEKERIARRILSFYN